MSIYGGTGLLIYCVAVAFIFGLCMGSFLNCAAYRVVRGESFIKGHSHCTTCGHELGIKDLVPVLSWLSTGGKCRYCGDKISARYPLTEIAFGIITVLCLLRFDLTPLCLRNFVFLAMLFMLTLTDIDDMVIPDGCHIVSIVAWVAALPFIGVDKQYILSHIGAMILFGGGLLAISLILDRVMGRDTMGGGDIKLIGVTGLYLGIIGNLFTLIIACILGLVFGKLLKKGRTEDKAFPFGPWIAAAAAIMLLFGEPLINWYLNLLL